MMTDIRFRRGDRVTEVVDGQHFDAVIDYVSKDGMARTDTGHWYDDLTGSVPEEPRTRTGPYRAIHTAGKYKHRATEEAAT